MTTHSICPCLYTGAISQHTISVLPVAHIIIARSSTHDSETEHSAQTNFFKNLHKLPNLIVIVIDACPHLNL